MTAKFRKGDLITMFRSWDDKGTVSIYEATVYSCGAKRMILADESGEKFAGAAYRPDWAGEFGVYHGLFAPRMEREAAEAKALELGAQVVAHERERMAHCIARNPQAGDGYRRSIEKSVAALHEPRVRWGEWKSGHAL